MPTETGLGQNQSVEILRVPVSALVLVSLLLALTHSGLYGLSNSFASWIDEIPTAELTLKRHWRAMREPIEAALKASDQLQAATDQRSSDAQEVVIKQPPLLEPAASDAFSALTTSPNA